MRCQAGPWPFPASEVEVSVTRGTRGFSLPGTLPCWMVATSLRTPPDCCVLVPAQWRRLAEIPGSTSPLAGAARTCCISWGRVCARQMLAGQVLLREIGLFQMCWRTRGLQVSALHTVVRDLKTGFLTEPRARAHRQIDYLISCVNCGSHSLWPWFAQSYQLFREAPS